jgi:beta-glucanase (GH16 family)
MTAPVTVTGMTFDEEFNTVSISPDSTSNTWQTRFPYAGAQVRTLSGNGEQEYYSDSSVGVNPFSVSNGVMTITASPGSNSAGLPYNSGILSSYGSFSQTYGYFEANMQLPAGQGLWPAFWMLPASNAYSSELDITEVIGSVPTVSNSTVHGMYGSEWDSHFQGWTVPDTSTGYHTYGVDWEPTTTTFYVDGQAMGSVATPDSMNTPMYMILNLAVGGNWPGSPNSSTVFPAEMKIDYVHAYATANTRDVSGRDAITVVPVPVTPSYSAVTLGSGVDTIALSLSEDAYLGNAQFTVSVDGTQIGGTQTAQASHAAGQSQLFTLMGNFGTGIHTATVNFLNDAYGGTASTDRNMYIDGATVNGTQSSGAQSLTSAGGKSFTFLGSSTAVVGANTLTVKVSEDAWSGDAQFLVTVDGKQVGATNTVTASHAAGASQDFVLTGAWGAGAHDVSITFINDAWGGSSSTDRNLYVNSVSYDGRTAPGAPAGLFSNGHKTFTVPASSAVTSTAVAVNLSEDAYNGNAQYAVSIDGVAVSTGEVSASHAAGQSQSVAIASALAAGTHDLAISFLNDAYGGTATTDRNLYVGGISINGAQLPSTTIPMLSSGTQHFAFTL